MANIVKIKRSTTTATPTLLSEGELAYSELSKNLFIGTSGGNIENIGGKIGTTVQAYNADTVIDSNYVHTDNNFTTTLKTKLDGIEAGATADMTASEILTAIKTVDGSTSGLDADLLDGYDSTYFYPASNPNGYTSNSGTVTSVAISVPTGLSVSGSPITTNGTLAVSLTSGYAIPTTSKQTNWDTAYTWYQTMIASNDADSILNTWAELVSSLNNAGESVNILNNGSTIDGGSF